MIHNVLYFYIIICIAILIFNMAYIIKRRLFYKKPRMVERKR